MALKVGNGRLILHFVSGVYMWLIHSIIQVNQRFFLRTFSPSLMYNLIHFTPFTSVR